MRLSLVDNRKCLLWIVTCGTAIILLLIMVGCGDDSVQSSVDSPYGLITRVSGCGGFRAASVQALAGSDETCVEYEYDGEGTLTLERIDVGLLCCVLPGADVSINDNVITVREAQSGPPCRCYCLYDMVVEIRNLPPGVYEIRFIELYLQPEDESLELSVDLAEMPSGSHCVERDHDGWIDDL